MAWNATLPAGNQAVSIGDDGIRANNVELQSSLEVEHTPFDGGAGLPGNFDGRHKFVTLQQRATKPTQAGTDANLYGKLSGGVTELFYQDDSGVETQLTIGGAGAFLPLAGGTLTGNLVLTASDIDINGGDIDLENNQQISGEDTGATARNLLRLNGSDQTELGDQATGGGVLIQGDGQDEFKVDYPASGGVKKIWHEGNDGDTSGMDADLIKGFDYTGSFSTSSSGGHMKLPNGLEIKWGLVTSVANDVAKVFSYPTAFDTDTLQVVVCPAKSSLVTEDTGVWTTYNEDASGFDMLSRTEETMDFRYIAIGH